MHLVDFGLFHKTPSEDSGSSGAPHSAGSGGPPLSDSPRTNGSSASSATSFFPTNIISSVGAMGAQVGAQVGAIGTQVGASVGAIGTQVGAMGAQVGASVGAVGYVCVGCMWCTGERWGFERSIDFIVGVFSVVVLME